jgi:PIN domain nuclease of toxin-antitoxin system
MVFSLASAWEMQIKIQFGKLRLAVPLAEMIEKQPQLNGMEILPVSLPHILELPNLPLLSDHKDPFDRIIIAQAVAEHIPLMSADPAFSRYPIPVLW